MSMIAADVEGTKIVHREELARPTLSIFGFKNVPICCKGAIEMAGAVEIMFSNDFWCTSAPQFVRPDDRDVHSRVIGLDPWIQTFLTGVNHDGKSVEIGHHLIDHRKRSEQPAHGHRQRLKERASEVQYDRAVIWNCHSHRDGKQWRNRGESQTSIQQGYYRSEDL
jgi:hypothetical protein